MPRVLFLSESRGWSGGAQQMLALGDGLRAGDWHVAVACPGDGGTNAKARERGLDVIDFHPRKDYDIPSAFRLARLLSERGIDVLHAHHPRAHAVGLLAVHLTARRPVFVVSRRVSFPVSSNPFSRLKYLSPRIDSYVAVAGSIRDILVGAGVAPERVAVIPSGVDLAAFAPRPKDEALARELALPAGVPIVGLVANYGEWKGQAVLLAAAAALKRDGVRTLCLFAGRDTRSPELPAKAESLGLGPEDVRFLGLREDVPRLLSLLDVSVCASTAGEGLSGAARESLAMGIPVAASDVGGNRELVQDGGTGRLFAGGDAAGLAAALKGLLADPAAARRMAEAGRRLVGERYGAERMISATDALYRALLARRDRARREPFQRLP